jgi:predicted RNase H-like HicB family nuclease
MRVRVVWGPSEDGGYTAVVPILPGCISEGETGDEALANIREAIELYLESPSVPSVRWSDLVDKRLLKHYCLLLGLMYSQNSLSLYLCMMQQSVII